MQSTVVGLDAPSTNEDPCALADEFGVLCKCRKSSTKRSREDCGDDTETRTSGKRRRTRETQVAALEKKMPDREDTPMPGGFGFSDHNQQPPHLATPAVLNNPALRHLYPVPAVPSPGLSRPAPYNLTIPPASYTAFDSAAACAVRSALHDDGMRAWLAVPRCLWDDCKMRAMHGGEVCASHAGPARKRIEEAFGGTADPRDVERILGACGKDGDMPPEELRRAWEAAAWLAPIPAQACVLGLPRRQARRRIVFPALPPRWATVSSPAASGDVKDARVVRRAIRPYAHDYPPAAHLYVARLALLLHVKKEKGGRALYRRKELRRRAEEASRKVPLGVDRAEDLKTVSSEDETENDERRRAEREESEQEFNDAKVGMESGEVWPSAEDVDEEPRTHMSSAQASSHVGRNCVQEVKEVQPWWWPRETPARLFGIV
jgi:hypothetical protein